ncbi:aspartate aminotransferase [Piptocephalis cylindrospora]|uniref:aspartate transaminase n=1 Tax=Piptocephalis cylindrospora TaxID=1907219 RepID=A0A4P9XYA7_9FUNG|nr:aspartate aminotransferase [Piptocephalis cylindrospora]|eukprot:RKP11396.1 aspartate aminotransferase [Piptocephalis cylindrospora]
MGNSDQGKSFFNNVPLAPPDPIFHLTASYEKDTTPKRINLGVGAYRDDMGQPWVLPVVRKARQLLLEDPALTHEYLPIAGLPALRDASIRLILGKDSPAIREKRTIAIQTISGTGANTLGAAFLAQFHPVRTVLVSNPTWVNHKGIFGNAGFDVKEYTYFDSKTLGLDLEGMLSSLNSAPEGSVIILHACAHNPTGVDPTQEQWIKIADVMEAKGHFPLFDCAYQGFASGDLDKDAWAVRYFVHDRKLECFIAQSYAKNFGLYGERCGALTVVTQTSDLADRCLSQLSKIARVNYSNPPAFGARIVSRVLNDPELYTTWTNDLRTMSGRIIQMRTLLREHLIKLGTPGNWDHITRQIGMFSFTGLKPAQVSLLQSKYHIYMTSNGRVSMAGLNTNNVEYMAKAVDDVVRSTE